jgi:hypothetical protein
MRQMSHSHTAISVARDFSKAPGPRYKTEGKHSGEQFRSDILFPSLDKAIREGRKLSVNLDGTFGFGTSFLEEVFGGLIRENKLTLSQINTHLTVVSDEEPELLDEIRLYMAEAEKERASNEKQ